MDFKDRYTWALSRTAPGPGKDTNDPSTSEHVAMRSIPNVSTDRLRRVVEFGHGAIHTADGLHEFDMPRRSLVQQGMKIRAAAHELKLRGEKPGACPHCWGE